MSAITKSWQKLFALVLVGLLCIGCSRVSATTYNPWKVVSVPTEENLLDISLVGNSGHGFLVGSNSTLMETKDGGESWQPIALELGDEQQYRFNSVSFSGSEGWVAGEPSLILHTTDEGRSWSRIPLSEKLPGNPLSVVALGPNKAEMATNVGAIYQTADGGKNWKAQVEQSVGVVRNLKRSDDGKYVAVSAKGNFYSTWEPGLTSWVGHNRNSSRRLENMGFADNGRLWMLARGGQIQFSDPEKPDEWLEAQNPERSASWGLLDLAYRTPEEIWIGGGGGSMLLSTDGGNTWQRDTLLEKVPANFYKVVFFSPDEGFVVGDHGVLLKYQQVAATPEAETPKSETSEKLPTS
ncbi:MAG: photosynthesis system II assembly factor Ycf48 [Scytonematopsis contorta HA4267-MV1]|jgi:photosystem II stability/assembly factor-like uncharacterized protein|nr:photosynthesis system II assembly factor Ycf48 [Scytonematopsis contorta HA4267-MV1]